MELDRFTKGIAECESELDWLLYVFRNSSSLLEIPEEIRRMPFFDKLLEACRIAAFPESKKLNYERNMMLERDIIAQREYAQQSGYAEGMEKGMAEGLEKGLEEGRRMNQMENARNLLRAGVPPEVIAECVGLNLEFVKSL